MTELSRPDPDALLRRMKEEEARAKRGKLRIFFGFAPGVGKTYRMLQVARDWVVDHKGDLVVGIVETHQRSETAALMQGLELLPRRKIEYRGRILEEFDLDAAIVRKPKIVLVDELAHSNAPGSRHAKRWQDVIELLDEGIDVLTTMNVQHVESLNDVISQITRIQVRETVPDSVLDDADSIELVDIAPEELLQRLKEGKVYLPEQALRAAEHFFQRGNLLALRELALRRTAQHVDEDVQKYREQHGVDVTWAAGERILVCVGPAPSSGRLIRAAARMAAGLRCPWVAAYADSTALANMTEEDRACLEVHLRVAESLGGTVTRLSGARISEALLTYARRHNVTRIVIGKPTHSRFRDRVKGSLLDEVVRGSGDIDVHVINGDMIADTAPRHRKETKDRPVAWHYLVSVLLVGATLGVALILRRFLSLPDPEMLFLLAVMLAAVLLGRGPSLLSAGLGVACYDFFFVLPFHTFAVSDRRYILTFAMMFGVGFVLSELAGRLKRQEKDALSREERTAVLYALSRDLASVDLPEQIAKIASRHAADIFSARASILQANSDGELCTIGVWPEGATLDVKELTVAKWTLAHGELAGFGTDTLPGSTSMCAPLRIGMSALGVLALLPKEKSVFYAEQRAFLDVFCRQVAVALEHARLAEKARIAALRAKTEEIRSSLLSSVSHDLRTPLASITGAATSLRDDYNLSDETRRELVGAICDEAVRLEHLVANLLDMTRLESGTLSLKKQWVPLDEIVSSALTHLEETLDDRVVNISIPEDLSLIFVDPVLFEQLFVNLFENASKYTSPETPIELHAQKIQENIVIEVLDRGVGVPIGAEEKIFDKFYRGNHANVSGVGLGLPICRGIAEAHEGTIRAEHRVGGGAIFRVTIPIGGQPPSVFRGDVT